MATARFIHDGHSIDYTPGSDISAGDVIVQGELVGVAKLDIAADTFGALAVAGVFDFPKATGGGTAIPAGKAVYWDLELGRVTANSGSAFLGHCVALAGDDNAVVRVRLNPSHYEAP